MILEVLGVGFVWKYIDHLLHTKVWKFLIKFSYFSKLIYKNKIFYHHLHKLRYSQRSWELLQWKVAQGTRVPITQVGSRWRSPQVAWWQLDNHRSIGNKLLFYKPTMIQAMSHEKQWIKIIDIDEYNDVNCSTAYILMDPCGFHSPSSPLGNMTYSLNSK